MRLKPSLLLVVDAYRDATGVPDSTVSRMLFGSGNRLRGLRTGRGMISDGIEDALQTLSDRWPKGAQWPCGVVRPDPEPLAAERDEGLSRGR